MPDTLRDAAARFGHLASLLSGAELGVMALRAARAGRTDALEAAAAFAGADRAMAGYGRGNRRGHVPLGATARLTSTTAATVAPTPSAPWALAEKGSGSYNVPAGGAGKLRGGLVGPVRHRAGWSGRRVVVNIAGVGPRTFTTARPMHAPARPAHETWTVAADLIRARTGRRADSYVRDVLGSIFHG